MLRLSFLCLWPLVVLTTAFAEEPPPAPVTTTRAVREAKTSTTELTATVTARRQAQLSARASGLIAELKVDAGDVMEEGDVLMSLDAELAELALERVKAAQAQAELAEAERLRNETRTLANRGSSSKSEAETRESAVRAQAAALQGFEAQVREQTALIARHRLVAPFAGVISRKLAEIGEWVQTGTPVVELVEIAHRRAVADIHPEALLQPAVELDARPVLLARLSSTGTSRSPSLPNATLRGRPGRGLLASASMPPSLKRLIQRRTIRSVRA